MIPALAASGDWVLLDKLYTKSSDLKIGDLVSFAHPLDPESRAIKRIVGMPGDFVCRDTPGEGRGVMMRVPKGHVYLVGDNLKHSRDSRMFGPLPLALIKGKVVALFGFGRWGLPWGKWVNDGLEDARLEDYVDDDEEVAKDEHLAGVIGT